MMMIIIIKDFNIMLLDNIESDKCVQSKVIAGKIKQTRYVCFLCLAGIFFTFNLRENISENILPKKDILDTFLYLTERDISDAFLKT